MGSGSAVVEADHDRWSQAGADDRSGDCVAWVVDAGVDPGVSDQRRSGGKWQPGPR